ncbi:serine hydrolase domain-containing protein [Puerhibacterium sp. TATVAM-FAB25]|uniref:serine hydrolase domain-containing protein n=1 Tax=Puerhibacterium sp. TATVAM-FAB25 TaxID=3093699 RepID=UPI00397D2BE6
MTVTSLAHAPGRPGEGWSGAALVVRGPDGAEHRGAVGTAADGERAPLLADALFDLASVTKAFVAVAALRVAEAGLLDLDAPVRERLDVAAVGTGATARHLLTHTAGLRAASRAWRTAAGPQDVWRDVLDTPPVVAPGAVHEYSCLSFVLLGALLEAVTGRPLDRLVLEDVAAPLGAASLRWWPAPAGSVVATEPGTPRGVVHDETAAALGRPVGNAGLFGTADDVARLAALVRDRGACAGGRLLTEASWSALVVPDGPARDAGAPYGQALGLRRGDPRQTVHADQVGHTGFTGTSFVVDLRSGGVAVLLTNRVHGGRAASVDAWRRELAAAAAGTEGGLSR